MQTKMKANEVKTLSQLVEFINGNDNYSLDVTSIIERNGWTDEQAQTFGVCSNEQDKVIINERGEAEIIVG